MSAPLRIVIDTNVLVSALLFEHSVPARAVQLAFREHRVLMSVATSSEIQAVLGRSKLSGSLSEKVRAEFIKKLQLAAIPIQVVSTFAICRDTRDDKFLQLAIDGEADVLVTGDADLLNLNSFRGVRILTPRVFLDEFESTQRVSKTVPEQQRKTGVSFSVVICAAKKISTLRAHELAAMPGQAVRARRANLAMMLDGAFSFQIASRTAL